MDGVSVASITKFLKDMEFPASKEEVIDYARENGADEDLLEMMEDMEEEEFGSISDVVTALRRVYAENDENEDENDAD